MPWPVCDGAGEEVKPALGKPIHWKSDVRKTFDSLQGSVSVGSLDWRQLRLHSPVLTRGTVIFVFGYSGASSVTVKLDDPNAGAVDL